MIKSFIPYVLLCVSPLLGFGQVLTGVATKWSDSFKEWSIFTDVEEEEGSLNLRWIINDDWTEWEYRLGEQFGRIDTKFKDNINQWEVRGDNQIITLRTLWRDNFREWRISDNEVQLTLKCRFGTVYDEWILTDESNGFFGMYTLFEGDPREWEIVDELDESVSFPMKMGLIFLVIYHSKPRIKR